MISMEAVWQLHSLPILVSQRSSGNLKARGITPQVQGLIRTALGTIHHNALQQNMYHCAHMKPLTYTYVDTMDHTNR